MLGYTIYAPGLGLAGLIIAFLIFGWLKKQPNGTDRMKELEEMIHAGAMAFLKTEYSVLVIFIAAVASALYFFINHQTAYAYLSGAGCSILAGNQGSTFAGVNPP